MSEGAPSRGVVEERAMERWISLEMGNLHKGMVTAARPLGDLLLEDVPTAPTRGGDAHVFDRGVLERFHAALSPLARRRLKLPATFYVDKDLPADAYLQDPPAMDLLRALGEIPADREARDGRLWVGLAFAKVLAAKYPSAFQFVYF